MLLKDTTIASISTALTPSGVGIIRISGSDSYKIINKVFTDKNKNFINIEDSDTHKVHYGYIYDKDNDKFIDEVIVLTFKAPRSFTREDVIEVQAHGGVYLLQKILKLVIKNGATLAEAGEFTKRAFLNGRIDLSQAEAVMDIINSENDYSIEASINQLKGNIKNKISLFKQNLLEYTAYIEACLDDPEHLDIEGYKNILKKNVNDTLKEIDTIINNYENGRIIKEGIKTVILGKPNVGKSSLLNLLLDENRAIVTDVAGTTRDVIKESINIEGITLHIIDTAGIRDEEKVDKVEKIGIEKAKEEAKTSDLILFMIDVSSDDISYEKALLENYKDKKIIILLNKFDLIKNNSSDNKNSILTKEKQFFNSLSFVDKENIIDFSTIDKTGFDVLKQNINNMFIKKDLDFNNQIYLSNLRQLESIKNAKNSLSNVITSIENNMPEDLYTIDLMDAITYLSQILGEEISDDLANTIFSKFCMGK